MRPPGQRTSAEWRYYAEAKLGLWWLEWEKTLRRHDDLTTTLAAGDNLAFFARQMGLGRQKWLGEALVNADMWDSSVLVLCPPAVRLYWHQALCAAGLDADRVQTLSAWQASRAGGGRAGTGPPGGGGRALEGRSCPLAQRTRERRHRQAQPVREVWRHHAPQTGRPLPARPEVGQAPCDEDHTQTQNWLVR